MACNLSQGILQTGIEKGKAEGAMEKAKSTALKMFAKGIDVGEIAEFVEVTIDQINAWIAEGK